MIAGLAVSMMANHAGNITQPAVEEPFWAEVWAEQERSDR